MTSALFKYKAKPSDPLLRDESPCGLIHDPDFWSNPVPVWAVCGPYYRSSLQKGDIVFFVPQKKPFKKAGFHDYIFTGFLVVDDVHKSPREVKLDPRITRNYHRKYRRDLRLHLRRDKMHNKIRTANTRCHNFIIGDKNKSEWFGEEGPAVRSILRERGLFQQLNALGIGRNSSIPRLTNEQAVKLRQAIREHVRRDH